MKHLRTGCFGGPFSFPARLRGHPIIPTDWSAIRRRYEAGETVAAIAADVGLAEATLQTRRRIEDWHRKTPRRGSVRIAALRRTLIRRIYVAIDMRLTQLEQRMQNQRDTGALAPAADWERETRALGVLIANLGKVTEFEAATAKSGAAKSGTRKRRRVDGPADDAERLRASLADRLERIVDNRVDGRPSGPHGRPDR